MAASRAMLAHPLGSSLCAPLLGAVSILLAGGCSSGTRHAETTAPVASVSTGEATSAGAGKSGSPLRAVNPGQCPAQPLLDDGEDGDAALVAADGRSGSWYSYVDADGSTIEPAPGGPFTLAEGGAHGSRFALRMQGKMTAKGNAWAGIGFDFLRPRAAYDISCCQGIAFFARRGEKSVSTLRVQVGDVNTSKDGGVCTDCGNDVGTSIGLTPEWKHYALRFDRMQQAPWWGTPVQGLAADRVLHVKFQSSYPRWDYEFWIDDVRLFGCGGANDAEPPPAS